MLYKSEDIHCWLTVFCFTPRLPVLSLYTLKEQIIAFAGSIHVVIMDVAKKEQQVS